MVTFANESVYSDVCSCSHKLLVILRWLREFRGVRVNSYILEYGMRHFLSVSFSRLEDKIVGLFRSL